MNKEDRQFLQDMSDVLKAIVSRLEAVSSHPVLFGTKCSKCGETTVHVSHIAREKPVMTKFRTFAAGERPLAKPLKTCLSCGYCSEYY